MLTHYIEFSSWMLAVQATRAKPLGGTTIPKNFSGRKVFRRTPDLDSRRLTLWRRIVVELVRIYEIAAFT